MNGLIDEQKDRIIKEELQKDKVISEKANTVFKNFNSKVKEDDVIKENIGIGKQNLKENKKRVEEKNIGNCTNATFYKKINRILGVAAAFLTVVIIGGTVINFNKNKSQDNGKQQGESQSQEIISYTENNLIKNEPMQFSKEEIVEEIDNRFVKVYIVGDSDIGVQFKSYYWDELFGEVEKTSQTYRIDGIDGKIDSVFLGCAANSVVPYLFILKTDKTAMYVDLKGYYDIYKYYYYYAVPLEGLDDISGFEEKSRKFSYSEMDYTYVNAIRSDGKRKEIEIGEINYWDDTSTKTFDKYNQKYIDAHNGDMISNDERRDFEVDGSLYMYVNGEYDYMYFYDYVYMNSSLYRIKISTGEKELLASGLDAIVSSNEEGKICVYVKEENNYAVYNLDKNVVIKHHKNEQEITEITSNKSNTADVDLQKLSEFERKVYESGDYYYNKVAEQYCIPATYDAKSAYFITNHTLFRTNIAEIETITCIASGVNDLYKDENGNLIAVGDPDLKIQENNDKNITYKKYEKKEPDLQSLSEFERKVYESGDYYYNKVAEQYCIPATYDKKSAYFITNHTLFRTNIGQTETITCIASGVNDLYKDENGNLIAVGDPDLKIQENNDKNITYKKYEKKEPDLQSLSEFERKVYESGDYYYNKVAEQYCIPATYDKKSAYFITNHTLFRTNIGQTETITCIASGVNDLYKDENGDLIAVGDPDLKILEKNDTNITYK